MGVMDTELIVAFNCVFLSWLVYLMDCLLDSVLLCSKTDSILLYLDVTKRKIKIQTVICVHNRKTGGSQNGL